MPLHENITILNGKYRILRLIGEGGMARVWLAEDVTFSQRKVAIKEPNLGLGSTDAREITQRFQREVAVSAALADANTPNIVQALTAIDYEDGLLLVMEYMPGRDLRTRIQQHPQGMPLDQVIQIAEDVLVALAGVHEHPLDIIHRDIKPSNILFDARGRARLADFGLAQVADWSGERSQLLGRGHPGTLMYMAPEQEVGVGSLSTAADVFALGAVLFEMLTGKKYKTVEPGARPGQLRAGVPAWLDEFVVRATAQQPQGRWRDGGQMLAAWRKAKSGGEIAPPPPPRQSEEPVPKPRSRVPVIATSMILLLITVIGAYLIFKPSPSSQPMPPTPVPTQMERATTLPTAVVSSPATSPPATSPPATSPPATSPPATPSPTPTLAPTPTPTLGVGSTMLSPKDRMIMQYVPAGEFVMGSNDDQIQDMLNECAACSADWFSDETPQHTVYLAAFWIDKTEVTNAMFAEFVSEQNYITDAERSGCGWIDDGKDAWECVEGASWRHPHGPDSTIDGLSSHPVVQVSWHDAQSYCLWAGRRLPTEAEWEKAARGPSARLYPWGNRFDGNRANFCDMNCPFEWRNATIDDGYRYTAPVDASINSASPYGVTAMGGNVWDWVNDRYSETYFSISPERNPPGPSTGDYRVVKGGSWKNFPVILHAANRTRHSPDIQNASIGFRCALSP